MTAKSTQNQLTISTRTLNIIATATAAVLAAAVLWAGAALSEIEPLRRAASLNEKNIALIRDDLAARTAKRFDSTQAADLKADMQRDIDKLERRIARCELKPKQ